MLLMTCRPYLPYALAALCSMSACAQENTARTDVASFQRHIADPKALLVDVRTSEEFSEGHIAGAVNIDWLADTFMTAAGRLDKGKPVLLYCAAGGRSEEALEALQKAGFTNVHDLVGGIRAWKKEGRPVTTE